MADSLLNLGTTSLFPIRPNWSTTPRTKMLLSRRLLQQPGTVQDLTSLTDLVPQIFNMGFTIQNKEEEYNLLDYIHNKKGKVGRFWVLHPKNSFVLKYTATLGSSILICYPNSAHLSYDGHERIWIEMADGDILTRNVMSVTYNSILDEMSLNLSDSLDREVNLINHSLIGRCLLVRFDHDDFEFTLETDTISEVEFSFFELVKEYNLI